MRIDTTYRDDLVDYLPSGSFVGRDIVCVGEKYFYEFKELLEDAKDERPIQQYLEHHPQILASFLDGHLGRWVLPQKRLGSEHVTDFIIGDQSSYGLRWQAIELESPKAKMFNKNGDPSAKLTHAIRQILDWRSWISDNKAYAQRKHSRGGLGLYGIRPKISAYIFIGRSSTLREVDAERRWSLSEELNIQFSSYDWLLRQVALATGNIHLLEV